MTVWATTILTSTDGTSNVSPTLKIAGSIISADDGISNVTAIESTQLTSIGQSFRPGALVELFTVDATALGGGIFRITDNTQNGAAVVWQGNTYVPIALQSEGWEINSQGELPQPKLRISNVDMVWGSLCLEFGDLVGAIVTRYRTFSQFLDNGSFANPLIYYEPDVYQIERKSAQAQEMVEFELSSPLDQEQVFLPGRFVLKYNCTQSYRLWNPNLNGPGDGGFDYSHATCPFNGSQNGNKSFDQNGNPTTDPNDVCGRLDSDCALRFPGQALQTWAFPGVGGVGA